MIDPWIGSNNKIIDHLIIPLITKASKAGFPVYIFTNNCRLTKTTPCPYRLNKKFNLLAKKFQKSHIIFWDNYNHQKFKETLHRQGISKLIYMGFASNMCVIGRPAGMVPMKIEGFSIYYIPEASAALEFNSTEKTKQIHNTMTQIIASWLANIIQFNEIYKKL
ncbi:MAG: isochorismatase family protein [Rickettsia endosymbiont of Ixodes persulcatus]|nr:isochorismatase family protein [Rickettsia endosymbiont of Ixodes persulcatus]